MFFRATTILAVLGIAAQVAVATPPACLIAAISSQTNPSDVKSICNSPSSVQSFLSSNCGSNQQQANSAFSTICSSAGVKVATPSSSSVSLTSSQSSSASSSSVTTTTGTSSTDISSSGSSTGSQTASPTSTLTTSVIASGTTPTSSSTPTTRTGDAARLGMDCVGLAALGVFGAMLAL